MLEALYLGIFGYFSVLGPPPPPKMMKTSYKGFSSELITFLTFIFQDNTCDSKWSWAHNGQIQKIKWVEYILYRINYFFK